MKITATLLTLFLVVFVNAVSFGQSQQAVHETGKGNAVQSESTVDPLAPAVKITDNEMQPGGSGYVMLKDGRKVNVDGQGVQSLAVPQPAGKEKEMIKSTPRSDKQ